MGAQHNLISGAWGWLTGKNHIKGSFHYLIILNKLLGKKFTTKEIPGIDDQIADFEINQRHRWKKPDKVLIINGSPRNKVGFTFFNYIYLSTLSRFDAR